jgi:hypothetical protein
MANFQTAAWYCTHPPARPGPCGQPRSDALDVQTVLQGLGLANEAAWISLMNEVVEAHNTKNMIPHPKIPDGFLIQGRPKGKNLHWQLRELFKRTRSTLCQDGNTSLTKNGSPMHFLKLRKEDSRTSEESSNIYKNTPDTQEKRDKNRQKKKCRRSDHYSGYSQTSLPPEPTLQPAPQSASTQAQKPFTTSHIPTTSIVAAISPLASSASPTSSYPPESPRPGPPPSPAQAQLLSATSKPPTTDATPLHMPTSIFNLRRMIMAVRRVTISKAWTELMSFFRTEEALNVEEAKLSERHFSHDVFEPALAQTSFLGYKDEEDQVMFQHSKLGMITIESASDWRTA